MSELLPCLVELEMAQVASLTISSTSVVINVNSFSKIAESLTT